MEAINSNQLMIQSDYELLSVLEHLYPDHNYALTDIKTQHPDLYKSITKNARRMDKTPSRYLDIIGFKKVEADTKRDGDYYYDVQSIMDLCNNYDINQVDIAVLLGCSRNNINLKIKKGLLHDRNKWIIPFNEEEISAIIDFIHAGREEAATEQFSFKLVRGKSDFSKKAIILKSGKTIKVAFDIPPQIQSALETANLSDYEQKELEELHKLNEVWEAQGGTYCKQNKTVHLDPKQKAVFNKWAKWKKMPLGHYFSLIGYSLEDGRFISDEEIRARIQIYSDEEHHVHLHSNDEDYHFFSIRAYRKNQNIYEFFKSYGYIYERGHYVGDTEDKHRNVIRSRYVVDKNYIYISSYDQYYGTLNSYALKKGITLDDFCEKLGFIRIKNKRDLPEGYIPFDYTTSSSSRKSLNDDNLAEALSIICNENGEVYLDVRSYLYYCLFLKSKIKNCTIDEIVVQCGYIRIYTPFQNEDAEQEAALCLEDDLQEFIHEKLTALQELESHYNKESTTSERIHRNEKLVDLLKDLYRGKCQLCDPENPIPPICQADGSLYTEVHHITSLHNASCDEDIEYIDSYKNTIVLCPYHHKYVHYHHGGFRTIVEDDDILYLENAAGEKLRIFTDYHLNTTESEK